MKRKAVVVDTNVPVVANGATEQAGPSCVMACIRELSAIRKGRRNILIDDHHVILRQFRQNLSPKGQPGLGDAFFKWLWDNQGNIRYCRMIRVTPTETEAEMAGYEEFPSDPDLKDFDRSDQIFVAVALASREEPEILNASDRDWWNHQKALSAHGIKVKFLCKELMESRS